MCDDASYLKGHDSDGANRDVLGGGKEAVDEDTHEGGVETIFGRQQGKLSVGHTLGYNHGADRQSRNKIFNLETVNPTEYLQLPMSNCSDRSS